jgi:hypothetical protein
MILHIMRGETESIVTSLGEINNAEEIVAHFIDLGILSWDSTRKRVEELLEGYLHLMNRIGTKQEVEYSKRVLKTLAKTFKRLGELPRTGDPSLVYVPPWEDL